VEAVRVQAVERTDEVVAPGDLEVEHLTHRDPHGTATPRIRTAAVEHETVDAQGSRRASDRSDVLRVVRTLEHEQSSGSTRQITEIGRCRPLGGGEHSTVDVVAGDRRHHLAIDDVHRRLETRERVEHPLEPALGEEDAPHPQRPSEQTTDHEFGLRDQHTGSSITALQGDEVTNSGIGRIDDSFQTHAADSTAPSRDGRTLRGMSGTIALQGGGPFTANDELDRRLLRSAAAQQVVVLPTADAFERPDRLVAESMNWAERMSIDVEALMVLRRAEAMETGAADLVRSARAVYLVGDQPIHLRSVLMHTPLYEALGAVVAAGGVVVAVGGSADALCDPMIDPRGGAFTLGLGFVQGLAVVTEAETWSPERLHRTRDLANTTFAVLRTGEALVRTGTTWETVGSPDVHGALP